MLITYFDEVKYQKDHDPYYWLGALVASAEDIWSIDAQISALAQECFGNGELTRDTEFHAADIFHRKKNFKQWTDIPARVNVICKLICIIDSYKDLGRIYVRIDPARMVANDYDSKAFIFLVEKIESFLKSAKKPGILIGDRENEHVSAVFAEVLSHYRHNGTPYHFGTKLEHLIDTVHFTSSHHSRMLQVADLYVWLLNFQKTADRDKFPATLIFDHLRENGGFLFPSRYKEWPTEQSWIRTG